MTPSSDALSTTSLTGMLNINKPAGITSHDVVKRVRRLIGIKKVGHTGTLDPMATGVLLVCIGSATRLIEYSAGEKTYQATLRFGQTTTTADAEGDIEAEHNVDHLTAADISAALPHFMGDIKQQPPRFSAIKQNGVPLYKLARKGRAVTPPTRQVHIRCIDMLNFQSPTHVELTITCGPGTYIRSLAHDLGQSLGVGAHLTALRRTMNTGWRLADSITLDDLEKLTTGGDLTTHLISSAAMVSHLPRVTLAADQIITVGQGKFLPIELFDLQPLANTAPVAAFDDQQRLVAILVIRDEIYLKPHKVFMLNPITDPYAEEVLPV